jgi:hypothetical protein
MAQELCTVCGLAPAVWSNRLLLGSDDWLCRECFGLWYEGAVTDRAEMLRRRRLHEKAMTAAFARE